MLDVQHKSVCDHAHDDRDHKERHQVGALWKNIHAVNGLETVSEACVLGYEDMSYSCERQG